MDPHATSSGAPPDEYEFGFDVTPQPSAVKMDVPSNNMFLDSTGVDEELFDIFQKASGLDTTGRYVGFASSVFSPDGFASPDYQGHSIFGGKTSPSPAIGTNMSNLHSVHPSVPLGSRPSFSLSARLNSTMSQLSSSLSLVGAMSAAQSPSLPSPLGEDPVCAPYALDPSTSFSSALSVSTSASSSSSVSVPSLNLTPPRKYAKVTHKISSSSSSLSSTVPKSTPTSTQFAAPYFNPVKQETMVEDDAAGEDDSERLTKRLARKAELARASRRRRKTYVHDLENKVEQLGAKIEELQRKQSKSRAEKHMDAITGEERERKESHLKIREKLAEIVKQKKLDEPTQQVLNGLIRKFVENSRQRQSKVEFYLDRVDACLVPGVQVKFALWGLDQPDDFYTKPGLWSSLMYNEVGVTEEQMRLITSRRDAIHQERKNLAQCERVLKETRERITQHLVGLNRQMDALQSVLTPLQLAKFYVWVEENEWCMQMLNSMWSAQPLEQ